ncbi:hypothetical protein GCM10010404_04590 [Nonomuraea africana]|uniref:DUF1468 domain-containing protein n=1 Tax=Nonomuraea africana TaxID=46171 RepID=A0ABR9KAW3_9ACTN|nr:tripartite tricarboxylate transporter TctB family protein [Nonomuraea africana]MBE1559158.1 hypothetical protein [Nonomuraea africana]
MSRRRQGEAAVWAGLTLLAAAMATGALGYGITKEGGQIGPGFLPFVAGVLLAVLAGTALAETLRHTEPEEAAPARTESDEQGRTEPQRVRILWTVFAMLLGALLLVPVTGFLVAFGLLVFAVSAFVERRRPVPALTVSAVAVLAIYAIFVLFLGVPLPGGLLGIGGES